MNLIQSISSTLKTWVFKKKLLKFSGRFRQDPEACFYCPEMCRFSCPTAETLKDNTVTPRGKMSLLHLAERGYSAETIAGSEAQRQWFLEQCTGCGRCTEYCVYENDVAANLRTERAKHFNHEAVLKAGMGSDAGYIEAENFEAMLEELRALEGVVLLCEPGRREWWRAHPKILSDLGVAEISEVSLPHRQWDWGKLADIQVEAIGEALGDCTQIWVESPEAAWFLAKAVKEEREALSAEVRLVWQRFFSDLATREFSPTIAFHESFHLSRLFPRLGYSIPMYERGLMPFHSGWNSWDCGGEGFYQLAYPGTAREIGLRFLQDLVKDGRTLEKIVCQSYSCMQHLHGMTDVKVVYWMDELADGN